MAKGRICDVAFVLVESAARGRVGWRDTLEAILSQNLVDVLLLVYVYFSWLLLHMHAEVPRAFALVSHSEGLTKPSFELKNRLQITAKNGYVVDVQLKNEPGAVADEDTWVVCRHAPFPAFHSNLECLVPLSRRLFKAVDRAEHQEAHTM